MSLCRLQQVYWKPGCIKIGLDENHKTISAALQAKKQALCRLAEWSISHLKRKTGLSTCSPKGRWICEKCRMSGDRKPEWAEHYVDMHATRKFFSAIKSVYGPYGKGNAPFYCYLIKDQEGLLDRTLFQHIQLAIHGWWWCLTTDSLAASLVCPKRASLY